MASLEEQLAQAQTELEALRQVPARCRGCGALTETSETNFGEGTWCAACYQRYPMELIKAVVEPFDYALGLRDGRELRFSQAIIRGEWVHLDIETNLAEQQAQATLGHPLERGISVRLSEIVWIADAPDGS